LVLLLDGYDLFPQDLKHDSLIADILNRKILASCTIIVSSCPNASTSLHSLADIKVDIWGFTKEDSKEYIKQALEGQPEKTKQLIQTLDSHWNANSLCQMPYNLAIFIFLYSSYGNGLPKNTAELYKEFIYATICESLGSPDLHNLPEPANRILKQLSRLSFESIINKKYTG